MTKMRYKVGSLIIGNEKSSHVIQEGGFEEKMRVNVKYTTL